MSLRLTELIKRLRLIFTTLYYLKPQQLYYRVLYRLRSPVGYKGPALKVRHYPRIVAPVSRPNTYAKPGQFTFMNQTIAFEHGVEWNAKHAPRLWLYNQHYFDFLQSDALRYDRPECARLMVDWIEKNPTGVGQGWDAYTLSLRIVNWIKWSLRQDEVEPECVDSLAAQAHWLNQCVEHHLMANHVLANAKGLVFAGVFLEGDAPNTWLKHGLQLLSKEHHRQILNDGGHCERSPMYHAIMLEDVLDLINLAQAYPQQIPNSLLQQWQHLSKKMQSWINAMCHPDGEIAFFNDATQQFASSPLAIADYAHRLGVWQSRKPAAIEHQKNTGFIRFEQADAVLIADIGSVGPTYQPGHAHAGTLSFELSLFANRVLVNSGISTYDEGPLRHAQRSTRSHNTVEVDGENSSAVWASFRVARRADVDLINVSSASRDEKMRNSSDDSSLVVTAEHNGYRHMQPAITHRREISLMADKLVVLDQLNSNAKAAVARFYLHPEINVLDNQLVLPPDSNGHAAVVRWHVAGAKVHWEKTHWHPELGLSLENLCLVATFDAERCELTLDWSD